MNPAIASKANGVRSKGGFLLLLACLLAVVGFLFHQSFKSEEALFSNDGPLGVMKSNALKIPDALTGYWVDLNWVGSNGSQASFSPSYILIWLLGPVGFAKFYGPITLLLLGVCAWAFFRTLKLPNGLCIVAALAAALNMNFFSHTCWGLGTRSLTLAAVFLALAALNTRRLGNRWLNAALAGLAVGIGVIEGADNGVIFSFFVAAFVLFQSLVEKKTATEKVASASRVGILALFAGFIAVQVLIPLVGIASKGAAGIAATAEKRTPAEEWGFATQWSLPPVETLRVIIPGLYGYRMVDMYSSQLKTAVDGQYWGRVGEYPGMPEAGRRSSGAGEYAGVLVVLVGIWALAQSLRRSSSTPLPPDGSGEPNRAATVRERTQASLPSASLGQPRSEASATAQPRGEPAGRGEPKGLLVFTDLERKYIWFWAAMGLIALLLAWGRHAPFYQLIYPLPFFKSIRNPLKFMHPCHLSLLILFAYGLLGLSRRYLQTVTNLVKRPAGVFEKRWAIGSIAAFVLGLVAFGIYASSRGSLVQHLMNIGFPNPSEAGSIADFSIREVGRFVGFLLISVAMVLLIQFGVFTGGKSKWAVLLLGLVVTIDLAGADTNWIVHYDYQDQYASNPVLDLLKDKPWEHRVTVFRGSLPDPRATQMVMQLDSIYQGPWLQWLFQYYNVQAIDMAQEPRPPADKQAYLKSLSSNSARLWELTNTRYIFGLANGFADAMNAKFDPAQRRFREHTAFDFTQTPGSLNIGSQVNSNGHWALIEFTGALPRAKVYSQWQVSTTNEATLAKLGDPAFDPAQTVLVSDDIPAPAIQPLNDSTAQRATNAGTAEFASYSPKQVELNVNAAAPSVLLLNDKFDPDWKVWVDGKPAKLLRCNYLMRGVQVPAGASKVRFHFEPSLTGLKVTLAAFAIGMVLCGLLFVVRPDEPEAQEGPVRPSPAPSRVAPVAQNKGSMNITKT